MSRRTDRINVQIRRDLSQVLMEEFKDPRVSGLVTFTDVEIAPDLRTAKVSVSIMGSPDEKKTVMSVLRAASGFFHHRLKERMLLRVIPHLNFVLDESIERGSALLRKIDQVSRA